MAVLSWGQPKVEIGKLTSGDGAPSIWEELPEIVKDTAKLNTEQGNKTEAIAEGGGIVDVRFDKSKYTFELELFVKKGDTKPIEDEDGIVLDNYAVRLTPEDPETDGFIMDKVNVGCVETWTSADGKRWKYTFNGLIPKTGKILKTYKAVA